MKLRIIATEDVRKLVPMASAIEIVKQAMAQLSAGDAAVPMRTQLEVTQHRGVTLFMPAYLAATDQLGLKIVSVFPRNLERGIPTIHALITVVDAATGQPTAVMNGTFLTAMRTGAVSGVATELLARPDAVVAAIFGAGVQGRTQLEAVCEVRDIKRVLVFDTNRASAEAYAKEMRTLGGRIPNDIALAASPREALEPADIVCTTTTAIEPVFEDTTLKPGTHINAVGAFTPDTREIPAETVQRARLFVDSREACWAEAGDLIIPRDNGLISENDVVAELGELVAGTKPGRSNREEITLFKSVGNAVQDVAVASRVFGQATELGLGTELEV
jgi:ornithine cyclodeaminase